MVNFGPRPLRLKDLADLGDHFSGTWMGNEAARVLAEVIFPYSSAEEKINP